MKKLFLFTFALVMTLSLAACGGETSSTIESSNSTRSEVLVDVTTEQGVNLKLPSDMPLQTINGHNTYINTKTGDNAVVVVSEVGGSPLSIWTEKMVSDTYKMKYDDVVIKSFENGRQINGKEALVATLTLTTPKGKAITMALVMVTEGTKNYTINFVYGSDNTDGLIAKNLQACIDSITINAA